MNNAFPEGKGLAACLDVPNGLERVSVVKRCPECWAIDKDMGSQATICVLWVREGRGRYSMMFLKIAAQR
jgi:hypothetical protein